MTQRDLGFSEDFGPRKKHRKKKLDFPQAGKVPKNGTFIVTPEIAQHWLDTYNTNNYRTILIHHARSLAREINDGRWVLTHQGIGFAKDMTLLDGQHRLMAIVLANQPAVLNVVVNLDVKARDVIDVGARRRTQDVLLANGFHNTAILAGALRLLVTRDNNNSAVKMSPVEMVDMTDLYPGIQEDANDGSTLYSACDPKRLFTPSVITFLLAAIRKEKGPKPRADFIKFMTAVAEGLGLERGRPELALRRRLMASRDDTSVKIKRKTEAALILTAFARSQQRKQTPVERIQLKTDPQWNQLPYLDR